MQGCERTYFLVTTGADGNSIFIGVGQFWISILQLANVLNLCDARCFRRI